MERRRRLIRHKSNLRFSPKELQTRKSGSAVLLDNASKKVNDAHGRRRHR